jgi:hypothetical protein
VSKRRRTLSPLAVALVSDAAARSAPIYSDQSAQLLATVATSRSLGLPRSKLTAVAESTAPTIVRPGATRIAVTETSGSMAATSTPGNVKIALIRAGWSLNGSYYSAEVLKASAGKWRTGLQAFADHAPDSEENDYPSGSIKNLAGVLTSDAVWNDATQCLEADVKLFAPWREALVDMAPYIGMSIRAWVYAEDGEAEGRRGLLVTSIAEARSVDFVTVPAAGGAILSVFEAARHGAREDANVGAWLESRLHLTLTALADDMYGDGRLTRDERIVLSGAIGDGLQAYTGRVEADAPQLYKRSRWAYPEPAATPAEEARRAAEATVEERRTALGHAVASEYGDDQTYTWVRDFDPDAALVWYDTCPHDGDNTTWQQAYTVADDGAVTLDGDPVEVVPRTVYDPAPAESEPEADIDEAAEAAGEAAGTPLVGEPGTGCEVLIPMRGIPQTRAISLAQIVADTATTTDVTDGTPPTVTDPPTEEETGMSGTQTGAPPVQAGTAPVVDTPPVNPNAEASTAASEAVVTAMQALTAQVVAMGESLAAVTARADAAEAETRRRDNREAATRAVEAALAAPEVPADLRARIAPRVTAAVLADIPVDASGTADPVALGEAITAAVAAESGYAAELLESAGVGRPRGLGSAPVQPKSASDFEQEMAEAFAAIGLNADAAKLAAHGRG